MSIDEIKDKKKEEMKKKNQVEVFTTPTCPYCTKIKKWMDSEGIEYKEHNVAQDKKKAKEMMKMSGERGVPQTKVGEEIIVGFQPGKIKEALSE